MNDIGMASSFLSSTIRLPQPFQAWLEQAVLAQLQSPGTWSVDFTKPMGEQALGSPDSVSWQVFKNPVSLFIGGVAAVIMELAEPRVRSGVWDHTSFRSDPMTRLQRTGLAAMVTVYGARSTAEGMISHVRRIHEKISGRTPSGMPYQASDPELLRWVHATAAFGFLEAYHSYVRPLPIEDRNRYYEEGGPVSHLYGADWAPLSESACRRLFEDMYGRLERSEIVFEFLRIMQRTEVLPSLLRPVQGMLLRAAVDITPQPIRDILGLHRGYGLRSWEIPLVRSAGRMADRLVLKSNPAVQACLRLQLPEDYLYGRAGRAAPARG